MLILQRREGEKILIGDDISVSVVSVEGNRVKLAISAPREVSILRGELRETEIANQESAVEYTASPEDLLQLLGLQGVLNKTESDPDMMQKPQIDKQSKD